MVSKALVYHTYISMRPHQQKPFNHLQQVLHLSAFNIQEDLSSLSLDHCLTHPEAIGSHLLRKVFAIDCAFIRTDHEIVRTEGVGLNVLEPPGGHPVFKQNI